MPAEYILKVSISLAILYALYWLVLRKLTFYSWNRWYFVVGSLLCLVLPIMNLSKLISNDHLNGIQAITYIPVVESYTATISTQSEVGVWQQAVEYWPLIFAVGTTFLLVRLCIQLVSFRKIVKRSNLLLEAPVKVYHVKSDILPFSFANAIFINPEKHSAEELKEIVRHEFVHVKQKHTVDILLAEFVCLLNWFNPFAWLIRKAVRQNLEFIADELVLKNGTDKKEYQYLLLKVIGVNQFSIASNFNFTSLKKRIAMMNKNKSSKIHLLKFLLVVPLAAGVLIAFRKSDQVNPDSGNKTIVDTIPGKKKPSAAANAQDFPAGVSSINIRDGKATVKLKDGTIEKYDLDDEADKKKYVDKYGEIPEPPVPPAPPLAPEPPQVRMPDDYRQFLKRNQSVKNLSWVDEPLRLVITLKDGTKDVVNVEDDEAVRKAEEKYGSLPVAPPPPPEPPAPPAPPVPPRKQSSVSRAIAPDMVVQGFTSELPVVSGLSGTRASQIVLSAELIQLSAPEAQPGDEIELLLEINSNTSREQLEHIKEEIGSKGYSLELKKVEYNNLVLTNITGMIIDDENRSVFTATDFSKLRIELVKHKSGKRGFRIYVFNGSVVI